MTDYTAYEDTFRNPWCPFFGESLGWDLPKHDPLAELGRIIDRARELLCTDCCYDNYFDNNWPTISEIEKYNLHEDEDFRINPERILLLREISRKYRCLTQYVTCDKNGVSIEGGPLHLFIEEIIKIGTIACQIKAPGYVIITVLAIKAAFNEGYNLVIYDEPPNPSKAWGLLRAAEKLVSDAEIDFLNEQLEKNDDEFQCMVNELEPKVELYNKQSSGLRKYNEQSADKNTEKINILLQWAYAIKEENKNCKILKSDIARKIIKRIKAGKLPASEVDKVMIGNEENKRIPSQKSIQNTLSKHFK